MSDCVRCSRPVHDTGYCCSSCSTGLTVALLHAALNAAEMTTTVARLDRIERGGGGSKHPDEGWWHNPDALEPTPLPYRHDQALDAAAVHNTLTTWVREIWEHGPQTDPLPRDTDTAMCCWLADKVGWLRMRNHADEAFDELHDTCRLIARIIDRPPDLVLVGQCDCQTFLYTVRGKASVTCPTCELVWDVNEMRQWLEGQLDARLVTAAEAAGWIAYTRPTVNRDRVRHLINVWASRNLITAHGLLHGDPTYRFADVMARLSGQLKEKTA